MPNAAAAALNRAKGELHEIHGQFRLALLRSREFAVVKQAAQADYVLLIQADGLDGETMVGDVKLVHPTSAEEAYSGRMTLSDITSASALRTDVGLQMQHLESWLERERREH